MSILDEVRTACATVAAGARFVRIDDAALTALASTLSPEPPPLLPEEELDDPAAIVAWNAVNFGSGWFPLLDKDPGLSGARTLSSRWKRWVSVEGPPSQAWLAAATPETVSQVFGQTAVPELMSLFATAWNELGAVVVPVDAPSAASLVTALAELPTWRDVHDWHGLEVPLLKRAQIVCSHLGTFPDLDQLTCFADNLVPHVLRLAGVLVVDPSVVARIDAEDLLESGEPAEVELRACAVDAVEHLAALVPGSTAAAIDHQLWQRGQSPESKAVPRHRCRCPWY